MLASQSQVCAYEGNNTFKPDIFPYRISTRVFGIPLEPDKVAVIVPDAMKARVSQMKSMLMDKCGQTISFHLAGETSPDDVRDRHLIILGNISNNHFALALYNKRQAFADAYFPGSEGVIINPTTSIWNYDRNALVIGVSRDEDIFSGYETFLSLLSDGVKTIETVHFLKTDLAFPKPPENIDATLESIKTQFNTFPTWSYIPYWGLCYYLSGDKTWADYFRQGCYALYERAEKSGHWVPEQWTTLYYELWRYFRVWRLIDEDPFFSEEDRTVIENLLWAYTWFLNSDENYPYYTPENFTSGIRQNHTSFHSLSLFYAHHYFREKYGLTDLDSLSEKYEPTFASQATSYRSNDDAGYGYMYYTPHQTLMYQFMRGGRSYLRSGKLKTLADLAVTVVDNRRDGVSFGDFSTYRHKAKGSRRWLEIVYPSMAAWYYRDGQYQWVYNWLTHDAAFTYDNMYYGDYAVDIEEEYPERFLGIFPVLLDDGALAWVARRTEKNTFIPRKGVRYVDKMSMRSGFDPGDEYLLLDGTSIFAHGHQDGNTISRLTWKDRIWLFEMDYIKHTPKYHNGVIIVKDGVQEEPPPLTELSIQVDFDDTGITRTLNENFNGADWERNIIWKKGRYFLFLDRIMAREDGNYRLECRWRTRGDVHLSDNLLRVSQGDTHFFISSTDDARKQLITEEDTYLSNWNYPYGNGVTSILYSRKDTSLKKSEDWMFVNLMHAVDEAAAPGFSILEAGKHVYRVKGNSIDEFIGLNPEILGGEGLYTDCAMFLLDERKIRLVNTSYLTAGTLYLDVDKRIHISLDFIEKTGELLVPGNDAVTVNARNIEFEDITTSTKNLYNNLRLDPGTYSIKIDGELWRSSDFFASISEGSHPVHAGQEKRVFQDFGLELYETIDIPNTVSAYCRDGETLLCADRKGKILRFDGSTQETIFQLPSMRPVTVIHAADINGDKNVEIITGDDTNMLYAYSGEGERLWTYEMSKFFGINANAVDIAVGDTGMSNMPNIYVATMGFKLYGFDSRGNMKWETLIRYHPQTKAGFLKNGNNRYVAVGTTYSTPLNVVSPDNGSMLWYTWEQVGDETKSVTDYCGIDLTDMVFMDTDLDGAREIVFGTRYNRVYALNAADGVTKWTANVGDEISAMHTYIDPLSGDCMLLVGTDAGDIFLLDRSGKRLQSFSLGGSFCGKISDIETLTGQKNETVAIVASTVDGLVIVLDDRFQVKASYTVDNVTVRGISVFSVTEKTQRFFVITDNAVFSMTYTPHVLKKSRFH